MNSVTVFKPKWRRSVSDQSWDRAKGLGVKPGIDTLEQYLEPVYVGIRSAQTMLEAEALLIPPVELLRDVHYVIFRKVHPWAGRLRRLNDELTGMQRQVGCPPDLIERNLDDVGCRLRQRLPARVGPGTEAAALAWYHGQLLAIHPFLDGNTAVALLVAEAQMKVVFGKGPRQGLDSQRYAVAVWLARCAQQYRQLEKLFCEINGIDATGQILFLPRKRARRRLWPRWKGVA